MPYPSSSSRSSSSDLLCVLVTSKVLTFVPDPPRHQRRQLERTMGGGGRVQFVLPRTDGGASASGSSSATPRAGIDPSLIDLAVVCCRDESAALSHFVHSRSCLSRGLDARPVRGARACLHEHAVGIAQSSSSTHRGLSMQQLHFTCARAAPRDNERNRGCSGGEPRWSAAARAARAHAARATSTAPISSSACSTPPRPSSRCSLCGCVRAGAATCCEEFMVVERPTEAKRTSSRTSLPLLAAALYLAPDQVPAFLEPHATDILTTGKSLRVIPSGDPRRPRRDSPRQRAARRRRRA